VPANLAAGGLDINWVRSYDKRMQRFNLEIILFAVVSLTILATWLFMGVSAFFQ
jgi:hypothetical protein